MLNRPKVLVNLGTPNFFVSKQERKRVIFQPNCVLASNFNRALSRIHSEPTDPTSRSYHGRKRER